MSNLDRQFIVGIVIDLTTKQTVGDRTFLDVLKENLVNFAASLGLNCCVFVGHPNNQEMPRRQGESVAAIARFQSSNQNVEKDFKQVLDVIGNYGTVEKHIVLVTDCYTPKEKFHYEKALILNRSRRHGCRFLLIGVGDHYDKKSLAEFSAEDCQVLHLADPTTICQSLAFFTEPI